MSFLLKLLYIHIEFQCHLSVQHICRDVQQPRKTTKRWDNIWNCLIIPIDSRQFVSKFSKIYLNRNSIFSNHEGHTRSSDFLRSQLLFSGIASIWADRSSSVKSTPIKWTVRDCRSNSTRLFPSVLLVTNYKHCQETNDSTLFSNEKTILGKFECLTTNCLISLDASSGWIWTETVIFFFEMFVDCIWKSIFNVSHRILSYNERHLLDQHQ